MNKIVVLAAMLATFIAGCNNSHGPSGTTNETTAAIIASRNTAINKYNAYSDLFLDSSAVEQFITQQNLNDALGNSLRSFYNARNFQFAWFVSDGLTEQALAFRSLYDYSKDSSTSRKLLDNWLDSLMTEDKLQVSADDASVIKTELMITWRFANWYKQTGPHARVMEEMVPGRKRDVFTMANDLLANDDAPPNGAYRALIDQLKKYSTIARNGGWPQLPAITKKYKPGTSDQIIVLLKKRLGVTEQWTADDTSALFNNQLERALKAVQYRYGYTPDGVLTPAMVKQLNVPAVNRVQQIIMNMERMHWMPATAAGRLILVNIPEFKLHMMEGQDTAFTMDIVVGKQGHSTVIFSGSLNHIVLSPYWNVPESIVRKEVLPQMERNGYYLLENDMEITGEQNGLPVIRQLPGEKNELGKVKFLFPNSFNIYFHDTPHKELFNKDKRAFSHGCIRLSEPVLLATYLLKDQPAWTAEMIDSAMNSGIEQYVKVKQPVPVLIYYLTAWVDNKGILQWREDIYNHDKQLAEKLFLHTPVPTLKPLFTAMAPRHFSTQSPHNR